MSNKPKKILFLFFIIFVLIIFSNIFQEKLRNFSYVISSPFQKILWQAGDKTADFFGIFIGMKEKEEKAWQLEKENQKLIAEIAVLKELKNENKNLRNALGIGLQKKFKLSFAQIIGKDISQDYILINKGTKDGILKNMPVITSQKILLGKISRTYKNFSKVMLLSSKKMSFDANIQSSIDVSGVGRGKGNSKILIGLIPREEDVSKGDLVVSGGLGGTFPEGLLVGRIKNVEKKDTETFQKIEVDPAFNIKKLGGLFIITGKK
jgi:rod shape-determining protein MreC